MSQSVADALVSVGLGSFPTEVVRPPAAADWLGPADRRRQRLAWGVDDAECVVAVPADPPDHADALRALWYTGLASETGRPLRLLFAPRTRGLSRVHRIIGTLGGRLRTTVDPAAARPWEILGACDIALSTDAPLDRLPPTPSLAMAPTTGTGGGPALAWAMRAGLPLVGEETPPIREAVGSGAGALLWPPARPRPIARSLCQLADDPAERTRLGRANAHAAERFDPRHYADVHARVYERLQADSRPATGGSAKDVVGPLVG